MIELLVTVAIVAILATIAMPLSEILIQRNKEQELRTSLRLIREAIDSYKQASDQGDIAKKSDESGYPKSLKTLVEGVENIRDPKKSKIYFLRRLPRDPLAGDDSLDSSATWGKRSYASPPDDPQAGDDVFDIYSLSKEVGLNGIRYRDW